MHSCTRIAANMQMLVPGKWREGLQKTSRRVKVHGTTENLNMYKYRPAFALVFAVSAFVASPIGAQAPPVGKTPLRIEDLYLFDAPKTPVLFPDGKRVVYIRSWI